MTSARDQHLRRRNLVRGRAKIPVYRLADNDDIIALGARDGAFIAAETNRALGDDFQVNLKRIRDRVGGGDQETGVRETGHPGGQGSGVAVVENIDPRSVADIELQKG